MSHTFGEYEAGYNELIDRMEIKPSWKSRIDNAARTIITNKDRYQSVVDQIQEIDGTTIPWQFVGVVHHLEGDGDFETHLHNGDSLQRRTVHVPAGRPVNGTPPFTWEESAIDALQQRNLQKVRDWSPAHMAYEFEGYNGFGYRDKGVNSPYLWSGTNNYESGKYVSDGNFDASAVSQQCGAMAILSRIMALDISPQKIVDGSRKLTLLRQAKAGIAGTFGTVTTFNYFDIVPDYVKHFHALGLSKELWFLIAGGAAIWGLLVVVEKMSVGDYMRGVYTPSKKPENIPMTSATPILASS